MKLEDDQGKINISTLKPSRIGDTPVATVNLETGKANELLKKHKVKIGCGHSSNDCNVEDDIRTESEV